VEILIAIREMVVESWLEVIRSELTDGGYLRWRRDVRTGDVLVIRDILSRFPSTRKEVNELIKSRSITSIGYHITDGELTGNANITTNGRFYKIYFFKGRIHGMVYRYGEGRGNIVERCLYVDGKPITWWY
jgi:hypothetical protein